MTHSDADLSRQIGNDRYRDRLKAIVANGAPCRTCKRFHPCREVVRKVEWPMGVTWADPDDGHPLNRMDPQQCALWVLDSGRAGEGR